MQPRSAPQAEGTALPPAALPPAALASAASAPAALPPAIRAPLLLSVFPSFVPGGSQMRFVTLANRLGPAWRHAIIAMDGNLSCQERLDPSLAVTFPPGPAGQANPARQITRLRAILRSLRPAVLLTHNWGSIEWALANRLPSRLVRHIHAEDGFGPEERARQLPRRVWMRRLALRQAEVLLPSHTLLAIARDIWRLPAVRLHHVPNGIDLARFAARPPDSEAPSGRPRHPGGVVIGTVAGLRGEKNVGRLVEAVALLGPRARLLVVGDGPERPGLEQRAAHLLPPGQAVFAGQMTDPAAAYRAMDIFALSSDTEQMPLSLLEAMASGLPVAATDVGDVRRMLADENRNFVTPLEAPALAAALARLIDDAELRARLGAANRARAEAIYGEGRMVAAWNGLLSGNTP